MKFIVLIGWLIIVFDFCKNIYRSAERPWEDITKDDVIFARIEFAFIIFLGIVCAKFFLF
mgnify:CR=1 FL=1